MPKVLAAILRLWMTTKKKKKKMKMIDDQTEKDDPCVFCQQGHLCCYDKHPGTIVGSEGCTP